MGLGGSGDPRNNLGLGFQAAATKAPAAPTVYQKIGEITAKEHMTMLIDGGHGYVGDTLALGDDRMLTVLKNAGVKHICLEFPVTLQSFVDMFAAKQITNKEFLLTLGAHMNPLITTCDARDNYFRGIANLITNASAKGIKVHAVDGEEGVSEPGKEEITLRFDKEIAPEWIKFLRARLKEDPNFKPGFDQGLQLRSQVAMNYNQTHPGFFDAFRKAIFDRRWMPAERAQQGHNGHSILLDRLEGAGAVASRILRETNGEKSVIYYGSAHAIYARGGLLGYLKQGDLDDILNARTIGLWRNKDELERTKALFAPMGATDWLDYNAFFEERKWQGMDGKEVSLAPIMIGAEGKSLNTVPGLVSDSPPPARPIR